MKLKLSKTQKIISLFVLGSIGILTAAVSTLVIILNKNKDAVQDKINQIKAKITDKDILIAPNVSTQNQNEIQTAFKNQLQKQNPSLNDDDLLKISTNLWTLPLGIRTEVIVSISVYSQISTLKIYVEKANLLKNSNVIDGEFGTIFQDQFKNLWAMGKNEKLQVLKVNQNGNNYVSAGWTDDNASASDNLLKNSNVNNGFGGVIFQDQFKNLWIMGNNQKLQVLKVNQNGDGYVNTGWTDDNSSTGDNLLKNSNVNNGIGGVIFQDQFKNLWTMGNNQKLQVLKVNQNGDDYVNTGWTSDNASTGDNLLKNSNVNNGNGGVIFQDQFKNLWTMGNNQKLQVLKVNQNGDGYVNTGWTDDNASTGDNLLKNSNVNNGNGGVIFQDQFKNLWTMGNNQKLQVLKVNQNGDGYVNTGWTDDNASTGDNLLKNSNVNNGNGGTIFQDQFQNLWTMGNGTILQVLKVNQNDDGYVNTGWTSANDTGLTNGSNITNGQNGTIFQDQFQNLWAMGNGTSLQVLEVDSSRKGYVNTGWTSADDSRLTKSLNIADGWSGSIFQDEFKNLWAMSRSVTKTINKIEKTIYTKLQVLKVNVAKDGYVNLWQKPSD